MPIFRDVVAPLPQLHLHINTCKASVDTDAMLDIIDEDACMKDLLTSVIKVCETMLTARNDAANAELSCKIT
jgi:hypothetical protein